MIEGNTRSNRLVCLSDMMATFSDVVGNDSIPIGLSSFSFILVVDEKMHDSERVLLVYCSGKEFLHSEITNGS